MYFRIAKWRVAAAAFLWLAFDMRFRVLDIIIHKEKLVEVAVTLVRVGNRAIPNPNPSCASACELAVPHVIPPVFITISNTKQGATVYQSTPPFVDHFSYPLLAGWWIQRSARSLTPPSASASTSLLDAQRNRTITNRSECSTRNLLFIRGLMRGPDPGPVWPKRDRDLLPFKFFSFIAFDFLLHCNSCRFELIGFLNESFFDTVRLGFLACCHNNW